MTHEHRGNGIGFVFNRFFESLHSERDGESAPVLTNPLFARCATPCDIVAGDRSLAFGVTRPSSGMDVYYQVMIFEYALTFQP